MLDQKKITEVMDKCLLNDEEMKEFLEEGLKFKYENDPFGPEEEDEEDEWESGSEEEGDDKEEIEEEESGDNKEEEEDIDDHKAPRRIINKDR